MQFHEYKSAFKSINQYEHLIESKDQLRHNIGVTEALWIQNKRPFYRVYPSIIKCLTNTKLTYDIKKLGIELKPLALHLPVGNEITTTNAKVGTLLVMMKSSARLVSVLARQLHDGSYDAFTFRTDNLRNIAEDEQMDSGSLSFVSMLVGIALLSKDERFARPILLQRDKQKFKNDPSSQTPENYQKAIQRARKRGVNGIAIGEDVEISPGFRRPHFGIRWTGTGGKIPKLVPIKGCLVNRSKLYPIPTGYLDS